MKILLALRPCSLGLAHRLAADDALAKAMGAKANAAVGYLFPRFFDAAGPVLPRPDLARTAQPWGAWRTPAWIRGARARAWFEAAQVRGWEFHPVLDAGSALHREPTQRWDDVLGKLRHAGASVLA